MRAFLPANYGGTSACPQPAQSISRQHMRLGTTNTWLAPVTPGAPLTNKTVMNDHPDRPSMTCISLFGVS